MNELFHHEMAQMATSRQEAFYKRDGLYHFAKSEGLDLAHTRCTTKGCLKKK